jgi:hypothetical protein
VYLYAHFDFCCPVAVRVIVCRSRSGHLRILCMTPAQFVGIQEPALCWLDPNSYLERAKRSWTVIFPIAHFGEFGTIDGVHLPSPLCVRDAPLESENEGWLHKVIRFVLLDPSNFVNEELCCIAFFSHLRFLLSPSF